MQKVVIMPPLGRKDIEAQAVSLLRDLQPKATIGDEPTDIESIFEFYIPKHHRIKTGYTDLSVLGSGILGYTDAMQRVSFVDCSLSDSDKPAVHRRFRATVGHECYHCMKHVPILGRFQSMSRGNMRTDLYRKDRKHIKAYIDPEWQAWEFSMSILMPLQLIKKYMDRCYDRYDMAKAFDVNPAFVDVRLAKLNLKTL